MAHNSSLTTGCHGRGVSRPPGFERCSSIAYQVVGDGPIDLVHGPGSVSHLEYAWEEPGYARYLRRLAAFSRLILFDKRGTGLSDRAAGIASLEERMDDVRAVMDAAGSERAVLFGVSESAPLACLFAATYPERTAALILYAAYASEVRQPDYPWPPTAEEFAAQPRRDGRRRSTRPGGIVDWLADVAPSVADDPAFRTWFGTFLRLGASPGAVVALDRMDAVIDVRHVLPTIRVPTLVLHRLDTRAYSVEAGPLRRRAHPRGAVGRTARHRLLPVCRRRGCPRRRDRGVRHRHAAGRACPTTSWPPSW